MEDCLNLRDQNLDFKNVRSMLNMSYAGCPGPSPAISAQFIFKTECLSQKLQENSLKLPILGYRIIQSHRR